MLEILDSPKHLVAMRVSGRVTAADVTHAYNVTDEALKNNDRISFFVEVDPSTTLTLEGLAKDLVEGLGQWGKLKKYYRAALVTDSGWMAALARVEGLVFCSIDVRVFGHEERAKAFAWAAEAPEPIQPVAEPEPSVHFIQTTNENVFAFEVSGRVRERDIKNAVKELKPFLERDGKFNALARMKNFNGFDLFSVFDDDVIRLKLKILQKMEKYAIVGAKPWLRNLMGLIDPIVGVKIRTFEASEEDEAWEWVGASQALLSE